MELTWQPSFFDDHSRQERLQALGDPLQKLAGIIDFEIFRPTLEEAFEIPARKSPAGRKRIDVVLMFKVLLLQRLYNLSDEQAEFPINDRASFGRLLGLHGADRIPDDSTIWRFRETLTEKGTIKSLVDLFNRQLEKQGLIGHEGIMVDASFVEVPRQRNSRKENELIKEGKVPEEWEQNQHKLAHKDIDARWTKKNNVSYYGYKNHVKADRTSRLILDDVVTDASVHDSQMLPELVGESDKGRQLFADSAYRSADLEAWLKELEVESFIHEKASRGRPLTDFQEHFNRVKSRVRVLVEPIFGLMKNTMNGDGPRAIGFKRNESLIGRCNLMHNMCRYMQVKGAGAA